MKRRIKPHNIRIFQEIETEEGTIKKYIHPEGTYLKAHVRQLSANEQNIADAVQDSSDIEFTINRREIEIDMFVEFKRFGINRVYQISGINNYEFFNGDTRFRAYEVNKREYDVVEWAD